MLLARRILTDTATTSNDAAWRYTLLQHGRDLAAEAGEARVALNTTHEIVRSFMIEPLAAESDLIRRIAPKVRTAENQLVVATHGLQFSRPIACE